MTCVLAVLMYTKVHAWSKVNPMPLYTRVFGTYIILYGCTKLAFSSPTAYTHLYSPSDSSKTVNIYYYASSLVQKRLAKLSGVILLACGVWTMLQRSMVIHIGV